jgi:hypothetical protein
MKASSF